MTDRKVPELLAPAGSYSAFVSAISAGADAVYMGGAKHNARIGAQNFTEEELRRAIFEAHLYGKKVYITLNTLVSDRELDEALDSVEALMNMGADAFIVQDLGLMRAISLAFPQAELHASTQCITHSLDGVNALAKMGARRVVVARELDRDNLSLICRESTVEIEAFVHGALCVCHSGACLFSSLVGGRSGNRGECAQPCRLPYKVKGFDGDYPLSLSDLTLSQHLTDLAEMGVSSLKIEGRMKSADYVGSVVRIFRELLDMGRDADREDILSLTKIFSRGGLTDGYYAGKLGRKMYGVRSVDDKKTTRELEKESFELEKVPLSANMQITREGVRLTLNCNGKVAEATSDAPDVALTRPIDEAFAREQVAKLGQTPFYLDKFEFSTDGSYILPKSLLNGLRRKALEGLAEVEPTPRRELDGVIPQETKDYRRYVVLAPHRRDSVAQLLPLADRVYAPLFTTPDKICDKVGVALPIIIKDSERAEVVAELKRLYDAGVTHAYAESLGSAEIALSQGFSVIGGIRINAYNSHSLEALKGLGFEGVVASSELTPPARRDLIKALPTGEVIWGRAPLMIMENCIMNLRDGCRDCSDFRNCRKSTELVDRMGIHFPVYPEYFHRCQIYNSKTTFNADRVTRDASFGIIFITDEKDAVKAIKQATEGVAPTEYTRKG